ncbi:DUF5643 domain-containing protein [Paenibacillus sp. NPDC058177]|uniref:DUF5643 domain-containing protein n=1 Tax=Paenibacillus sp. NPDC058177 TaxID=3346369 RepID=UPI0036D9DB24
MRTKTMKLSAFLFAATVGLGGLGIPAAIHAAAVQPAANTVLNTAKASDSHDKLTLTGVAQFDGNYIKINLSREGTLYSGNLAGITLNAKGEPYLAEGTLIGVDATISKSEGTPLKSPRWISDGDANKAVVVLQTGWLDEKQKASLASSELSVNLKLNGVQDPYTLKFSLKQGGLVRNIQAPAPKADKQFKIQTNVVAVGEASVRIGLTVTGVPEQAQAMAYDIYDNLGNKVEFIARESAKVTKDTTSEDLLFEKIRPDAQYLTIRPYEAVFENGNSGVYKLDAKGEVVKNYNKQLEIKIPLK